MKLIGLYVKQDEEALRKADMLEKWLHGKNISVVRVQSFSPDDPGNKNTMVDKSAPEGLFCVFVLGGDGTFLSASRWVGQYHIPLIGVKFGEVGFLAETAGENLFSAARRVLEDDYVIEERSRLIVKVMREGTEIAGENCVK